jgi:hypothetical protein
MDLLEVVSNHSNGIIYEDYVITLGPTSSRTLETFCRGTVLSQGEGKANTWEL